MGKVLCSIGAGPQRSLLTLAARSFRPYARRHGYSLDLRTEVVDPSRPPAWSKVALIRELLERHEVVVWLDADTIVVRGDRDIADDLPGDRFLGLVEHTVAGRANPNTGVMAIRAGDEAQRFFGDVWDATEFLNHRWWEQAAVMQLLGYDPETGATTATTPWREGVQWLDKSWNSIRDDPAANPRIRHWPGYTVTRRYAEMALALVTSRR
jgi:hypothetical protein